MRIVSFLEESDKFLQLVRTREFSCSKIPWIELKEQELPLVGNSEAMLSITICSFSLEMRPVKAPEARTRMRKLDWNEHLLMGGMKRKGSKVSPASLEIGEGLRRDKSINIGHKLGCTTFFRFDRISFDEPSESNSVATFSSLSKNGCDLGYL